MKNYITSQENVKYMVFEASHGDEIDRVAAGMLDNNELAGLMPFTITQFDEKLIIKYDITSLVPVSELLDECMKRDKLIGIIDEILSVYSEAENYLIEPESIILDCDKIFYNKENGTLWLAVMPILNKNTGNPPLNVFLKNLICRVKFDSTENCDYIGKMLGYLNSGKDFSLSDFRYIVDEQLSGMEVIEPETVSSEKTENSNKSQIIQHKTAPKPAPPLDPEFTLKKPQLENDDETETGFKLPLDFYADDENEEEIKNKKGIFSKILKGKSKKRDTELQEEKIKVQFCDKNGEISKETELPGSTVLLSSGNEKSKKSFLLRIKNNEKIMLGKSSFKIGTEKKSVDYCINDNCAVSRFHAEIIRKNDAYFIIDNNSTNHTFLNEREIKSKYEMKLQNKSRIRLADEEFIFYM